ncbi:MAG: cell division protein FtsW, partial [Chloroflexi bacterium]|nr:cell division protein FtsW [Chloroflexota bacterium]
MTVRAQTQTLEMPRVDYILFLIVISLLLIGLLMIWSITLPINVGADAHPYADVIKQTAFAFLGLFALIVAMRIDYRVWDRLALLMFAITIPVLIALLFNDPVNGARRWFNFLGEGTIQPGELAKFSFIVYIAKWLSSKGEKLRKLTYGLIPFAVLVGFVDGLIVLQPNVSTALIIGACAIIMFFVAGADMVQFLLLILGSGITAALLVTKIGYLAERVAVYLRDPLTTVGGAGYQILQTIIFLGSGGFLGKGIGMGVGKFGFVPTPQTDSIFAMLGEEFGLVGTWTVLALYLGLAYRGFRIAARARDPFGQLLATGITVWLIFQAFINIGVVTASIPFTGVPLPFISYGGSALITALGAVGVLLNISRHADQEIKDAHAIFNFGWRNRGTRVSRVNRRRR